MIEKKPKIKDDISTAPLVVFNLDVQRFAIKLSQVEQVIRVVAITPLPKAPSIVLGVVNIAGKIIPVVNIRERFGLPARSIRLSDQLLIARSETRSIALWVDETTKVIEGEENRVFDDSHLKLSNDLIAGTVKIDDGIVLIHDLDKFLSLEEEEAIDSALELHDSDSSDNKAASFES